MKSLMIIGRRFAKKNQVSSFESENGEVCGIVYLSVSFSYMT